jgi:hypothetical protein
MATSKYIFLQGCSLEMMICVQKVFLMHLSVKKELAAAEACILHPTEMLFLHKYAFPMQNPEKNVFCNSHICANMCILTILMHNCV